MRPLSLLSLRRPIAKRDAIESYDDDKSGDSDWVAEDGDGDDDGGPVEDMRRVDEEAEVYSEYETCSGGSDTN